MVISENANSYFGKHRMWAQTQKGDVVMVRTINSGVVERVVWATQQDYIFVCSKECFDMLERGTDAPSPIGFPSSDIIGTETAYD